MFNSKVLVFVWVACFVVLFVLASDCEFKVGVCHEQAHQQRGRDGTQAGSLQVSQRHNNDAIMGVVSITQQC